MAAIVMMIGAVSAVAEAVIEVAEAVIEVAAEETEVAVEAVEVSHTKMQFSKVSYFLLPSAYTSRNGASSCFSGSNHYHLALASISRATTWACHSELYTLKYKINSSHISANTEIRED